MSNIKELMVEKIYGNRSAREQDKLGGYFSRHMEHLTSENLREKGEIAMELAHRDIEIDKLHAQLTEVEKELGVAVRALKRILKRPPEAPALLSREIRDLARETLTKLGKTT